MATVKEREGLNEIAPYQAAKSLEALKRELNLTEIIKLAGNENRIGCSVKVLDAILAEEKEFSFYPDTNCTLLKEKLGSLHKVDPSNLIIGNGSFELIALLAHAYLGEDEEAIIPEPSFGWYKNVTLQMNAKPVLVPLEDFAIDTNAVLKAITPKTKLIWICNPNNPTGTVLKEEELRAFIRQVPDHILIAVDEAYIDFVEEEYFDTVSLIRQHKNVILLRTFSKLYGLASFRVGYGIAEETIIENLNKIRSPINVSLTAQKAAAASLEDEAFAKLVLNNNKKSLELYYKELNALKLKFVRSNGNFILIETKIDGKVVEDIFLQNQILIRNAAEFGLDGWIRVSIGTFEENKRVIRVLKEIVNKNK
ncbi:histidinol-phosphate transaminase [Konateibacter massiliensis]|uniref:histidinol-phosphate transaminase n=1 Tax=Konateibacter massiliensis TaxID=2002841 RepID=UPI000C15F69C|nr:histidinol-phosphate transaminase [Konateibacter massiliensis]